MKAVLDACCGSRMFWFNRRHPDVVFKWCEDQVSTAEVLKLASHEPLFGHRRGKTVFLVFMKSTTPN